MLHITVLRWLVRTYCAKMLRIAWKMDDEYQQKSFYVYQRTFPHSHQMFSHRITTLFIAFWIYRRKIVNIIIFGRFSQTIWCSVTSLNALFRHSYKQSFLHLLILKVGMFKLEALNNMLSDLWTARSLVPFLAWFKGPFRRHFLNYMS